MGKNCGFSNESIFLSKSYLVSLVHSVQGDPKQTVIFEMNTTLLWVNLGKRSNWILQWDKNNIWNHALELGYFEKCIL